MASSTARHLSPPLEPAEAARIYRAAVAGEGRAAEATAFRRHMLLEMARMREAKP